MGIIILMIGEYIMAIDKNRIKNFENNNAKNVKSKNVDKVNMELLLTLNETTGLIQEEKCKDAVPFIYSSHYFSNYNWKKVVKLPVNTILKVECLP